MKENVAATNGRKYAAALREGLMDILTIVLD
jgi:hypothetical protein